MARVHCVMEEILYVYVCLSLMPAMTEELEEPAGRRIARRSTQSEEKRQAGQR